MSAGRLQQRWQQQCELLKVIPAVSDKWWKCVETKYTEVQRSYHTLDHLDEMFTHLDIWRDKIDNTSAVSLAIYFHDIVYEPRSSSNELDSIVMFGDFSEEASLAASLQDSTVRLIEATITHVTGKDGDKDLQFFLDFDMAVLGRSEEGYKEYAAQISKEYSHLDLHIYNTKRAEVLKNFLSREHIFSTGEFQQLYEERARNNIAWEITLLQKEHQ